MDRITEISRLYPQLMSGMGRLRSLVHEGMDLTYNQYKTLMTVADRSVCTLGDLAGDLEVAMSTASQMVDRLVARGLVEREIDTGNRRQVNIRLTSTGCSLLEEFQESMLTRYRSILERLPAADQDALVDAFATIAKILNRLDREGENPT